jgi:hypothetical protein
MTSLARRDPSTRTVGADNVTMLLWKTIELVPGISRDELVARVGPRINDGHAKRRYVPYLGAKWVGANSHAPTHFKNVDVNRAKRHLVTSTLSNMRRDGSVERDDDGGYHVLRRPRTAAYQENDDVIDVTGEITRHHMRKAEAIRTLKAARTRFTSAQRACLSHQERDALGALLDLLDAEIREAMRSTDKDS